MQVTFYEGFDSATGVLADIGRLALDVGDRCLLLLYEIPNGAYGNAEGCHYWRRMRASLAS